MSQIEKLRMLLADAERKSEHLAMARASLPPGTSRARVTTANARWARAAEAREAIRRQIDKMEQDEK